MMIRTVGALRTRQDSGKYRACGFVREVACVLAVCFMGLRIGACGAERSDGEGGWRERGSALDGDARACAANLAHFAALPLHMDMSSYAVAGCVVSMGALVFTADESMRHFALAQKSDDIDRWVLPWQYCGARYVAVGIAATLYTAGWGGANSRLRETGRQCLMALACASLVSLPLKVVVGRERPNENEGAFGFDHISLRNENHSFPSGHTTAAFALSTVLALRAKNAFAAAGLYTAACMTAVQRVYGDDHWLSDAMFGAVIGTACGIFTVRDSKRTGRPATLSGIELTPLMTRSGAGIGITRRF